eukprot:6665625-Alexandrium_andersonii.AAC.1
MDCRVRECSLPAAGTLFQRVWRPRDGERKRRSAQLSSDGVALARPKLWAARNTSANNPNISAC